VKITPGAQAIHQITDESLEDKPEFSEVVEDLIDFLGNDPIIGLGLSITYRDVRIVSELLAGSEDWSPALFAPYAEERRERMRRLRFVAGITSDLDAEVGEAARERRRAWRRCRAACCRRRARRRFR
jgi:hypothetical protein